MKRQRVTSKRPLNASFKGAYGTSARTPNRASLPLKSLTLGLFVLASILMTGSTAFLYKLGLDPIEFYSNMANPYMKLVNIDPGLRREQIAEKFAKVLSWSEENKAAFIKTSPQDERGYLDGYYLPGSYWVKITATGEEVAHQMLRNFNAQVSAKILDKSKIGAGSGSNSTKVGKSAASSASAVDPNKINLDTAVRVASIIQREASGNGDMQIISGVIWNRLFRGMTLDMDATLQYAKATSTNWWPAVQGKDKYIDSPFNTYQNKGLPPIAIANPSIKALQAAFNPAKTDCLFYIHDNNRRFHCAKTYEAHKANVQRYLVGKK